MPSDTVARMSSDAPSRSTEAQAFAQRLRRALEDAGYPASPTLVAHEFNLRYWGRSISIHAARNWLQGVSLPRHDKLRVLADWLRVSPEALLLGAVPRLPLPARGTASLALAPEQELALADQRMFQTYLRLSRESRRTVQTVVAACEALDAANAAAPRNSGSG